MTDADELYRLRFDVMRSAFYHQERESWFSFWHRMFLFFSALAGTTAGATFLGLFGESEASKQIGLFFSGAVTFMTTLDLVMDLSGKARLHSSLRSRFYAVLSEMESEPSPSRVPSWRATLAKIYAEEPPTHYALDAVAWNQAYAHLNSEVKAQHMIRVSRQRKFFRNLLRYSATDFFRPGEG